jgi:hypothetical protein
MSSFLADKHGQMILNDSVVVNIQEYIRYTIVIRVCGQGHLDVVRELLR